MRPQQEGMIGNSAALASALDQVSRLAAINQEASQLSFDLSQARSAALRGDWNYVQNSLYHIESAANRIQRASQ